MKEDGILFRIRVIGAAAAGFNESEGGVQSAGWMVRFPDFQQDLCHLQWFEGKNQRSKEPARNALPLGGFGNGKGLQLSVGRNQDSNQKAGDAGFGTFGDEGYPGRNGGWIDGAGVDFRGPVRSFVQGVADPGHGGDVVRPHGPDAERRRTHGLVTVLPKISASERRR